MRERQEIDKCLRKLILKKFDSLISLCELLSCHPYKIKKIYNNKVLPFIKGSKENPPRQILEKLFVPSGNLYIVKRNYLIKKKSLIGKKHTFHIINNKHFVNIDNYDDFNLAKIKLMKYFK